MNKEIIIIGILLLGVLTAETSYFGDFRYRYEIEQQDSEDELRDRQRIRARFGTKFIQEKLEVGLRFATSSGKLQSAHQTLGGIENNDNVDFGLDRAYLKWDFGSGSTLTMGKSAVNWWQQNEVILDGDFSPEGLAYSYKRGTVTLNLAQYVMSETDFFGMFTDDALRMSQLVYGGELGGVNTTVALGNAALTYQDSAKTERSSNVLISQFNKGDFTLGIDYHVTDLDAENTALVAMLKTKLLGHSIGLWYYDVAENGVLSHDLTQDNFPITDSGWSGVRFQIGFMLCDVVKTDLRYYLQTIDTEEEKINRAQVNFNVKL